MITLYGYPQSRSFRVLWALEELGVDYRYEVVDLMSGAGRQPPFSDLNPAGKVPAIQENDFVLTESAAICTWLGDRFADKGLVPISEGNERAYYNEWCYFILTELEQPLWTMGKHRFVFPPEKRLPAIMEIAEWEFQQAITLLEQKMAGRRYALNDKFSMVDILLAHTLKWAKAFGQPVESKELNDYLDSMLDRQGCKAAGARDKEAGEKLES